MNFHEKKNRLSATFPQKKKTFIKNGKTSEHKSHPTNLNSFRQSLFKTRKNVFESPVRNIESNFKKCHISKRLRNILLKLVIKLLILVKYKG